MYIILEIFIDYEQDKYRLISIFEFHFVNCYIVQVVTNFLVHFLYM